MTTRKKPRLLLPGYVDSWRKEKSVTECLEYCLDNKRFTDVTFKVGREQKTVQAHRLILSIRSGVFEAMFYGPLAEQAEIVIPDVEPNIFEEFLTYLYTDDIRLSKDNVNDLLRLSKKYDVTSLAQRCLAYLPLEEALPYNEHDLEKTVLNYILENGDTMEKSAEDTDIYISSFKDRTMSPLIRTDDTTTDIRPVIKMKGTTTGIHPVIKMEDTATDFYSVIKMEDTATDFYSLIQMEDATTDIHPVIKMENTTTSNHNVIQIEDTNTDNHPVIQIEDTATGNHPVIKMEGTTTGIRPVIKMKDTTTGNHPVIKMKGTTTGIRPVIKMKGTTTDDHPVIKMNGTTTDIRPVIKMKGTTTDNHPVIKMNGTTTDIRPVIKMEDTTTDFHSVIQIDDTAYDILPVLQIEDKTTDNHPAIQIRNTSTDSHPVIQIRDTSRDNHPAIKSGHVLNDISPLIPIENISNDVPPLTKIHDTSRDINNVTTKESTTTDRPQPWNTHKKRVTIRRFDSSVASSWQCSGRYDNGIMFSVNQDASLLGFQLYCADDETDQQYDVTAFITNPVTDDVIEGSAITQTVLAKSAKTKTYDVQFPRGIQLTRDKKYNLVVNIKGPLSYSGLSGRSKVHQGSFVCSFFKASKSKHREGRDWCAHVSLGQIPGLLFLV